MPITAQNLLRHELVGLEAEILECPQPGLRHLKGTIVDETRNMLSIDTGRRRVRVPKAVSLFRFRTNTGEFVELDGKRTVGRPQDRIRMRNRA